MDEGEAETEKPPQDSESDQQLPRVEPSEAGNESLMLAEGAIGGAEEVNAVQIDKLDVAGSQSQPLIQTIADGKEGFNPGIVEKERQATVMDLVGGQEVTGH